MAKDAFPIDYTSRPVLVPEVFRMAEVRVFCSEKRIFLMNLIAWDKNKVLIIVPTQFVLQIRQVTRSPSFSSLTMVISYWTSRPSASACLRTASFAFEASFLQVSVQIKSAWNEKSLVMIEFTAEK